jgi:GTPase
VLELAPLDGSDPEHNFRTIEAELAGHDPRLATLPRILVLSKADLVPAADADAARAAWRERLAPGVPVLVTSSATGQGLDALGAELFRRVPAEAPPPAAELAQPEALAEHRVFRPAADRGFAVERTGDGAFRVRGERVERLLLRFDVENEEAAAHVERRLVRMGVIEALENEGFEPGDEVEIGGVVLELDPTA